MKAGLGISAQGGDDVLIGGSNTGSGTVVNQLIGDFQAFNTEIGGNDRLISGTNSTDIMVGDGTDAVPEPAGSDTFVFLDAFGSDIIRDFSQAEGDLIEFQIAGVDSFEDLVIEYDGMDTMITTSASEAYTLTLAQYDNITDTLTAGDFIFT